MKQLTDIKSIKQCRCPECDSPDFTYNKKEKVYECLKCGMKYIIKDNKKSEEKKWVFQLI